MGDRGLLHFDRLEAAGQGGVLLHVLAVLVEGRRPDRHELSTAQERLQDRSGVDRPLRRARPYQGVQLVDEQDDVAPSADLVQHLFKALFEIAPVMRARYQGSEVQSVDLLVVQGLGHVAGDDALGQALDDGRLAHARLPDEDRVALAPPREHLHYLLDLWPSPDHGVKLVHFGQLGQVVTELVKRGASCRYLLASRCAMRRPFFFLGRCCRRRATIG